MDDRQEYEEFEQKPLSDIAKRRPNTATAVCYLVAVGVFAVNLLRLWTHMLDGERLSMAYGLFNSFILPYAVWFLFSVLLLDIFADGIKLQKALAVAAGVILLAAACMNVIIASSFTSSGSSPRIPSSSICVRPLLL